MGDRGSMVDMAGETGVWGEDNGLIDGCMDGEGVVVTTGKAGGCYNSGGKLPDFCTLLTKQTLLI